MTGIVCEACGENNRVGTEFCTACHAFLGWRSVDPVPVDPVPVDPVPVDPGSPSGEPPPAVRAQPGQQTGVPGVTAAAEARIPSVTPRLHARLREPSVVVSPEGAPAGVELTVRNTSSIVDGYRAHIVDGPAWLQSVSDPVELLPGGEGRLLLRLRVSSPSLVPAQELSVGVRVVTTSHDPVHQDLSLSVTVDVLDAPLRLEVVPRLLRTRDQEPAQCLLRLDNPANRPVQVALSASEAEGVVDVRFERPLVNLGPGESASVPARLIAPPPPPGQEVTRHVVVSASEGARTTTFPLSLVQAATASPISTLRVQLDPAVLRVRDADDAVTDVVVDNRQGASGARVRLEASDPERALRFFWAETVVDLGPGTTRRVRLHLHAWRPDPGQEVARPFTVSVTDGRGAVSASGTLQQASSPAAISLLALQLEPSVLRLAARRGRMTATVDNRRGREPVRVSVRARDPEHAVEFDIRPSVVEVAAGQMARVAVDVRVPRAAVGREVAHPVLVVASDGQAEVSAQGSVIQAAVASKRPLVGVLLTLLGALAVFLGVLLPWNSDGAPAVALTANQLLTPESGDIDEVLDKLVEPWRTIIGLILTAGGALMILAVVALFGLTGRTGRLTRIAALVAAGTLVVVVIGGFAYGLIDQLSTGLGLGVLGAVALYIGGHLIRR